jgi:hypothetical protein
VHQGQIYSKLDGWKQADRTLSYCFDKFPNNVDEIAVTVKVILINSLYYTSIKEPLNVVNHILKLTNTDSQLQIGDVAIVDAIPNVDGIKFISFASKYAHFNNKAAFPLYDKYVCMAIADFYKQNNCSFSKYANFFQTVDVIRKLARLNNASWDDLDKYMWLYGQKLSMAKGRTDIGKELRSFYNTSDGNALFSKLDPVNVVVNLPPTI